MPVVWMRPAYARELCWSLSPEPRVVADKRRQPIGQVALRNWPVVGLDQLRRVVRKRCIPVGIGRDERAQLRDRLAPTIGQRCRIMAARMRQLEHRRRALAWPLSQSAL